MNLQIQFGKIRKFLHSSNITYYKVLKFGDDPTVGLSIHINTYERIIENLGSNDQPTSYDYQNWTQGI